MKDVAHALAQEAIIGGGVNAVDLTVRLKGFDERDKEIALKTSLE